jgi:hypothetical protein
LESIRKLVGAVVRGRCFAGAQLVQQRWNR